MINKIYHHFLLYFFTFKQWMLNGCSANWSTCTAPTNILLRVLEHQNTRGVGDPGDQISIILNVWERNKFHDLPMWTTINLRLLYNQVFSTIVAWTKWLSARTTNRYLTWPWRSSEARKGFGGLRFRGGSLHWFWSYFPIILGSCNSNSFIYGKLEHVRPLNMLKELFTSAE